MYEVHVLNGRICVCVCECAARARIVKTKSTNKKATVFDATQWSFGIRNALHWMPCRSFYWYLFGWLAYASAPQTHTCTHTLHCHSNERTMYPSSGIRFNHLGLRVDALRIIHALYASASKCSFKMPFICVFPSLVSLVIYKLAERHQRLPPNEPCIHSSKQSKHRFSPWPLNKAGNRHITDWVYQ